MFRRSSLAHASLLALLGTQGVTSSVWAQTEEPQPQTLERVEVTGSAIRRTAAEGALPVTVLKQEDIKRTGATSITDLIQALPQMQSFVPASNSVNGGGSGVTTAALHSLPSKYTLVLLDGQRVAPLALGTIAGGGYGVNLESIPLGAIERVEVLTDGAAALYGSDAIAGVVNFITKKNSSAGDVLVNLNHPQRAGGSAWNAAISKGFGDLETNGFNLLVSLGHDNQEKLEAIQRPASKRGAYFPFSSDGKNYIFNAATSNTEPANATFTAKPIGASDDAKQGYAINPYYRANGNCGTPFASVITDADGTGALGSIGESCRFNYAATVQDIPQSRRDTAFGRFSVKVAPDTTVWASAALSDFVLTAQYAPGAQPLPLSPTRNPVLYNKYVQPFLDANGLEIVGAGRIGYRTVDLGGRTDDYRTKSNHYTLGIDGYVAGFDYSVAAVLSSSVLTDTAAGGYSDFTLFNNAVANGSYDPFAGQGDSAIANGVLGTQFSKTTSTISTLKGQIQHELFNFGLGADAVKLAVGGEVGFTRYKTEYDPLYLSSSGFSTQPASDDYPIGGSYGAVPFNASRHNYGAFSELSVPVIKQFEMSASIRYDHYGKVHSSNVFSPEANPDTGLNDQIADADLGNTFQSTTGKLSAKFTPIEQLALRGSYGSGFKAPNLNDIAGPLTFGGSTSGTYACPFPGSTGCIAGSGQYDLVSGGNGNSGSNGLKPEKSRQWTIGLVAEPVRGLSARADVWDVKLSDQILSSGIPEKVAYGNPSTYSGLFLNPYADPAGFTTIALQQVPINGGTAEYRGLDWGVSYLQKFDFGLMGASASGTQMFRQQYNFGTFDSRYRSSLGKFGEDQQVVFKTILNLSFSLDTHDLLNLFTVHYRSGYKDVGYTADDGVVFLQNPDGSLGASANFPGLRTASYTTVDWQGKYSFSKAYQLTLGVRNITDRAPPFTLQSGGGGNQIGYDGRYADPIGRTYYMTGEFHF